MIPEDRLGHRQRLREKFELSDSPDAMPDYELLELLLTYAIPRRDVKPLAKELLARFHSFPGVMDASPDELAEVVGLGRNTATLLKLVRVANVRYLARRMESLPLLTSPELFAELETMFAAFLDARGSELKSEFYIPAVADELIRAGKARCRVLTSVDRWFGVTYQADRPVVADGLAGLIRSGRYPERLFGKA